MLTQLSLLNTHSKQMLKSIGKADSFYRACTTGDKSITLKPSMLFLHTNVDQIITV